MTSLLKKLSVISFLFLTMAVSAQQAKYNRVKIYTGTDGILQLSKMGIETDHGDFRKGVWLITDLSEQELAKVQQAGFRTEIMINDVSDYYKKQNLSPAAPQRLQGLTPCATNVSAPQYSTPSNFSLGSMGGYFTYQEMIDNLDAMAAQYPNLISIKQQIGTNTTIEGRPVYYVKISDNPNVSEPEPQMLYTAVHHAREAESLSQLIYYMWYLLEKYSSNTLVQYIVNNSELYFIPCVNPDGYIYNETMEPNGGGMWRKNRRDNLDGEFGVDLNRNYPYEWGFDDNGSSPNTVDETYRGASPASEPEIQIVEEFTNSHQFKIALNYHTYGNLLIYPWGYIDNFYTPDSALFVDYAKLITRYNHFTYGTDMQTVGYITNGSSDDWMYGEQASKPKILAMTPEVGDGQWGFWPPSNEIIPIAQTCMFQNLTTAQLLGKYALLSDRSASTIQQVNGFIKFSVKQLGLDTTGSYTVSLAAVTSNINTTGSPKVLTSFSPMEEQTDSISYTLNSTGISFGEEIKFLLSINNGQYTVSDTIVKIFGQPIVILSQNNNTMSGWNASDWGVDDNEYYSPTGSIADSPFGNYAGNEFNTLRLSNPVSLTNASHATLSFYTKWAIETGYDYVEVAASSDGGTVWTPLCGKYTKPGNGNQDLGNPLYDGFQTTWVKEEMSLDDYIGQNILIRFLLVSDGFQEYDGFYFDDLEISKIPVGGLGIDQLNEESFGIISCTPNPASGYTVINYSIPASEKNTVLVIYDATGRVVKNIAVDPRLKSIQINTADLVQGVYFYRLSNLNNHSPSGKLLIVKE